MQHPDHLIATTRARMTPQRVAGLAFVGLLHIALIYALVMGLMPQVGEIFHGPIVLVQVPQDVVTRRTPPPSTPTMADPTEDHPVVPTFHIDDGSHDGITLPQQPSGPPSSGAADTSVRGIASTHTIPDYPPLARRLNQEGTVQLRLAIAPDGSVASAVVESSSGSDVLDQAAIDWVKAHWRYQPATQLGAPVSSTTEAAIRFDLKTATR